MCAKIVVGVRNIANSVAADNWIRMSKPEASKNNARVIRSRISDPGRTPSRSGRIVTRTVADAKGQLRRQEVGNWDDNDAKRDVAENECRGRQEVDAGSKTSKKEENEL
jgi:hypothetical protein